MTDTQPVPIHIDAARTALDGVLAGEPEVDVSLAVGLALALLDDVRPPYPPLVSLSIALDAGNGITGAQRALARALREARTVEESSRIGRAGAELAGLTASTAERQT